LREIKIIGAMMRLLTSLLIGGLFSFWPGTSNAENSASPELCEKIRSLVALPVPNAGRSISFSVKEKTAWGTKTCRSVPNDFGGTEFCRYMLSHTSNERLAPNILRVIACLETGTFPPPGAHMITEKMSGKFSVYEPFYIKNIEVEFEYHYADNYESPDGFALVVKNIPAD
jgi:hypothetical protein